MGSQVYEPAPVALMVAEAPRQIAVGNAVAFIVGRGTTLTSKLELLVQVPLLAATEKVVFTVGETRMVFVSTLPGVQV